MKFLDYITDIITLTDTLIEGDGNCIFLLQANGFGVPGDGAAQIEFSYIQVEGEGDQVTFGVIEFPLLEILAQDANSADNEFPIFEVSAILGEPIEGDSQFPILEVEAIGKEGNTGEYYFYVQVYGEGNVNREYEPCD